MAHSATATQGFEKIGSVKSDASLLIPGNPGVTGTLGNMVSMADGVAINRTADLLPVGRVQKTKVLSAASVPFVSAEDADPASDSTAGLFQVEPLVPAGTPIYKATFAGQYDETSLTSYTASTRTMVLPTGMGANNRGVGAIMYVYAGAGAGQVNVIESYTHSGTATVVHRDFETALDSTSKIIILAGEAASAKTGIGFFGRLESDHNNLVVNNGYDNGKWVVYMDWREAPAYLEELTLPVIPASAIYSVDAAPGS